METVYTKTKNWKQCLHNTEVYSEIKCWAIKQIKIEIKAQDKITWWKIPYFSLLLWYLMLYQVESLIKFDSRKQVDVLINNIVLIIIQDRHLRNTSVFLHLDSKNGALYCMFEPRCENRFGACLSDVLWPIMAQPSGFGCKGSFSGF